MAKKPKRSPDSAAHTLDALESQGDRLVEWIGENPQIILGTAFAILAAAGIYGYSISAGESSRNKAAAALAELESEYREAMGASSDDLEIVEPANPETARRVREEYVTHYRAFIEEYAGSPVATVAALDLEAIHEKLEDDDAAMQALEQALGQLAATDPARGFILTRMAALQEQGGDWAAAAKSYESASGLDRFPVRFLAMADAARCYAEAGDTAQALSTYARIESEAPDFRIPEHIEGRLMELRATQPQG